MLMVSTVQVLPLSDVVRPLEVASVRTSVSTNELSSESRRIVVDVYSV